VTAELLLDGLLLLGILVLAYRAIHAPTLFTGVVLYITFGLLLSLVWVRLGAPDVAIAEAAIGAGVTGALLLDTAGQLGPGSALRARLPKIAKLLAAAGVIGLPVLLVGAVVGLAERSPSLAGLVRDNLASSGADHAVTAVLLDFRGYDTFLEVTVLLAAGIAVVALRRSEFFRPSEGADASDPVARASAALVIPFAVLTGGYLIWRGAYAPGGAFQAGAVLGAAGLLLAITRPASLGGLSGGTLRASLGIGCIIFIISGSIGLATRGSFLAYPSGGAGLMILVIELAVATSVAATLALLFVAAARPASPGEDELRG
jgi:multisubunit Na+/H+ antiporter MnhB subunit